ncbi:MFS general substrate transporter [Obba rivulosa]|uniref:MFS general substrate transporter n=1 Tax=Obba rivulosa TaxID=1052685 RepID=A0A8E2J888_9APHY|nr:MFS general substrate transporter [Obba rivulosa]
MSREEDAATLTEAIDEHLAIRSLEEVSELVDPRISPLDRPDDTQLDEGYVRQLGDLIHHHEHPHAHDEKQSVNEEPLYIEFEKGDKRDPVNFTHAQKWAITLAACFFTLLVASGSASFASGFPSITRDLNCTEFQATVALSMFSLGFGILPLVSASFSEEFGRRPLYLGSAIGYACMHLMAALSQNIQTVIVARFLGGAFGSTGSTMVGGTIADIWMPHERGLPMAVFSVAAFTGVGLGPIMSGWIESNPHLEWRWIQWIHLIMSGVFIVIAFVFMKETRSSVLLMRAARKLRKRTGNHRYRARVEDERASLKTLVYISCTRPIYLLLTEPVVTSFTLWVGFAWGILFVLIESVAPVFRSLHGFSDGPTGTVFVTLLIGCILGILTNTVQERLYQKYVGTRGPEARLFAACGAAVLFPTGMFIFAWSTFSNVPWIVLCIGMTIFIWALFVIYVAVFTYLADCYGPFASSALAGQSLVRNLAAMAFPLFCQQMFARLTYHWGNSIFGFIAVAMIPIPFVLFFKGPAIRARSKFASQVMQKQPKT